MTNITILDGAMGSLLAERGADTALPLWSARALLDRPELVRDLHVEYIRAGAQVITTNTFRTHRRSLAKAGLADRAEELTRLAVDLAREASDQHGISRIAGSLSPLEDCYAPHLSPSADEAANEHDEQAARLARAGVDLLLVETMPAWIEAKAALHAALKTKLDTWFSLHTREPGRLLSGESLAACLGEIQRWPSAVLVNCIPTERALDDVLWLREYVPDHVAVGVYANIGSADGAAGWTTDEAVTPDEYARHAEQWADAGATIIGGCCGTNPAHIAALAQTFNHETHLRS
ncbi:MAG: homocysteine S-methyltransferase family protein [Phycisphaerales bacterium]|nr:homocysteine S-methyltransferase family protein [Phycisphaerales bacterium]